MAPKRQHVTSLIAPSHKLCSNLKFHNGLLAVQSGRKGKAKKTLPGKHGNPNFLFRSVTNFGTKGYTELRYDIQLAVARAACSAALLVTFDGYLLAQELAYTRVQSACEIPDVFGLRFI